MESLCIFFVDCYIIIYVLSIILKILFFRAERGSEILTVVAAVKAANPAAIYFCDPVMGHSGDKGAYRPRCGPLLTEQALPVADTN